MSGRAQKIIEELELVELVAKNKDYHKAREWLKDNGGLKKYDSPSAMINEYYAKTGSDKKATSPKDTRRAGVKDYVKKNPKASNQAIGEAMGISKATVKRDLGALYDSGDLRPITSKKTTKDGGFYSDRDMISDPMFKRKNPNAKNTDSEYIQGPDQTLVKNPDFKAKPLTPVEVENRKKRKVQLSPEAAKAYTGVQRKAMEKRHASSRLTKTYMKATPTTKAHYKDTNGNLFLNVKGKLIPTTNIAKS